MITRLQVKANSTAIVGWDEGGPGQVHAWLEKAAGWHVACFVHPADTPPVVDVATERSKRPVRQFDFPENNMFKGLPLLSSSKWIEALLRCGVRRVLIMTGNLRERLHWIEQAQEAGLELISAVHPSAMILDEAYIGPNVVVYARAVVGYRAELHLGTSLNTGAQVDHHNWIGRCVRIDPGAVTAGNVVVEDFTTIHTHATIINKIRIGSDAIIGAGAVIIRDVPSGVTVVGVPGRIIKTAQKL